MAYRCCNYDHCNQEFSTREDRERHEMYCQVPEPPPPGNDQDQQKAS
jgi:hypothetical protein